MRNIKLEQYKNNKVSTVECTKSEETKRLISKKAKERYKDKTKHPSFGKTRSIESKNKSRQSQIGKKTSTETKNKMSESHSGKKCNTAYVTEDWSKKQSEIQKSVYRKNTKIIYVYYDNELIHKGSTNSVIEKFKL